jgi:hypothetical protein
MARMARLGDIGRRTVKVFNGMQDLTTREKRRLVSEMSQVRGLMPLLMKPRNNQKWSREDKALLAQHMKRISALSPYLVILVMPGGFFVLPALAWWLDRRRLRDRAPAAGA